VSDIGNSLREARVRRGLTIKDVEAVTKIRSKYLEALEENDYEVLPGPTYVKAFLRTYASFLKLDPDELLEDYRQRPEIRRDESGMVRSEAVQQSRTRTAAERKKKRTHRSQRSYAIVGVLAVLAIFLLAWFGSGRGGDESTTLDSGSFSSSATSTTTSSGSSTTTEAGGSSQSTTASSMVTTGENVALIVSVSEGSCWLVVREDNEEGAELFAGTLSAGGQKTFDTAKRYWMNVGEPDVLVLSINGSPRTLDAEGDSFIFVVTEAGVEPSP
jgi:cytoskeleton protein RodZ